MTIKNHYKSLIWLMGFLLTGFIAGCGSGGDGGSGTQAGMVSVSLTDAPACGYDEVNVTVSKVRVHQSGSADDKAAGWTDITLNPARKINLLNLNDPTKPNFALENLGETPLAAGHYTQLRLVLVDNNGSSPPDNYVILSDTKAVEPLETPSAIRSGVKLIHQFTVNSGQRVDLLLDFDACKSIVRTGNGKYILKPVIKVIPFVLNGIEGFVDPSLLASNVIVSAQVNNGEIVRATMPNTSIDPNMRGKFFLARLPEGVNYNVVITADDHATAVITGVPVPNSTSITTVSTSSVPIPVIPPPTHTLEGSATHSIGGTVMTLSPATDEATVFVAAKQAFVSGPTVTVKSQVATLLTVNPGDPIGDYGYNLMLLPTAAPSLGPYATPLPIVFTQQPASVGGAYSIQGFLQTSTTVYATQIPSPLSVNISVADAVNQDFTLTP